MGKKFINWKTKGMNRDMSVSVFSPEFAFENKNLRLETAEEGSKESNTLLSWVNEKGTKKITISSIIQAWDGQSQKKTSRSGNEIKDSSGNAINSLDIMGITIGTATLNHQLILFTTTKEVPVTAKTGDTTFDNYPALTEKTPDRIYVLKYDTDADERKGIMTCRLLYRGNLNFNPSYPLETMVSYEADYIQKVYWTDNLNQPRLINIATSDEKVKKWVNTTGVLDTFFDFVPSFTLNEDSVTITKQASTGGLFAPGVIQYAITYVNKYGQESNIAYISTLYYLAHSDRGASPEDNVTSSFRITITSYDTSFDYIRIYSIQRTSLNLEPFVKRLDDIPTDTGEAITYVDNGTMGSTVDPTELLYIGGKEIKVLSMTDKDGTLFMGNITQKNTLVPGIQDHFDSHRGDINISFSRTKSITLDHTDGIYSHTNFLNENLRNISTFKGGEWYRFGFQLQKKTGEWSEPIFIKDAQNELYPITHIGNDTINLTSASAKIYLVDSTSNSGLSTIYNTNKSTDTSDFFSTYKSIRPVIVYPTIADRSVLCQGVLNPTVFNAEDRETSTPYSQASWFFRPYIINEETSPTVEKEIKATVSLSTIPDNASEMVEESLNITVNDGASTLAQEDLLTPVYVLIADVPTGLVARILAEGLPYQTVTTSGDSSATTRMLCDFWGCILISDNTTTQTLAFFRKGSAFPEVGASVIATNVVHRLDHSSSGSRSSISNVTTKYLNMKNVETEKTPFYIYSRISVDSTNKLFSFKTPTDFVFPGPYIFEFYCGSYYYTVTFESTGIESQYNINKGDDSGSTLRFKHYDSLYTLNDINSNTLALLDTDELSLATQLEIEGAVRRYEDVSSTSTCSNSNTQFFVDQSIVTLNSPDIEFDTEVQKYNMEGVKLRVIGVIPITANTSSHSINISSSMLETQHNKSTEDNYFGIGELGTNIMHTNLSTYGGKRLVADYLWNDVYVVSSTDYDDGVYTSKETVNYLVYPWQRSGSLNTDIREKESTDKDGKAIYASSYLDTKKESHLLYSINSVYENIETFENISCQIHLTENNEILNIRLPKQGSTTSEINYYPNIDKVLTNEDGYKILSTYRFSYSSSNPFDILANYISEAVLNGIKSTKPISMKYKSMSHAVIALNASSGSSIPILPYGSFQGYTPGYSKTYTGFGITTFWGDTCSFIQKGYNCNNIFVGDGYDFLWLGELYKEGDASSRFGGTGKTALLSNNWQIGGPAVDFDSSTSSVTLNWTEGDTFYQRYDCLKTYPFTNEDPNQITEILSFMCETHVNIDGRYDRNRGQLNNYNMTPTNFNILNPVYSQKNNFFTSRKLDTEDLEELSYPNHIYYSKTKESGADVDLWTNVTLASTLELDGDKGQITSLNRFNNQLIAFQDNGIAQILYNENTQLSTTEGVPVEIANSGKVQGKRYISDTIGCSNKWSISSTPLGLYFIDDTDRSVYLFNGQLTNISTTAGFSAWFKRMLYSVGDKWKWNPLTFNNFRTIYDKYNQEVMFINDTIALAYSERFSCFTSFYDYMNSPFFNNLDDTGIWNRKDYWYYTDGGYTFGFPATTLYQHHTGEYCNFFGEYKPYSMTLIANQEPQVDKIFTNLEFRAYLDDDGFETPGHPYYARLPFNQIDVWNEYQHGIASLSDKNGHDRFVHAKSDSTASLNRKFRIWRCDIPRDNAPLESDEPYRITRTKVRPLDRIRNPWVYITLTNSGALNVQYRAEIHDIMATYFG